MKLYRFKVSRMEALSLFFTLIFLQNPIQAFSKIPQYYAINILGGGGQEETIKYFFDNFLQYQKFIDKTTPPSNKVSALGDKKWRGGYYVDDLTQERSNFSSSRNSDKDDCADYRVSIKTMFGIAKKKYIELSLKDYKNIKGTRIFATRNSIKTALDFLSVKTKEGDHLFLSLVGHGDKQKSHFIVSLGNEEQDLSASDFFLFLRSFINKKVYIHYVIDACYGGGLLGGPLLESGGELNQRICGVASSNDILPSSSGPLSFDQYMSMNTLERGNLLEAFACSLAGDIENSPTSDLDVLVDKWMRIHKKEVPLLFVEDIQHKLGKILSKKSPLQKDRERLVLIKAFETYYSRVYFSCLKNKKQRLAYEAIFNKEMLRCLKKVEPSLYKQYASLFTKNLNIDYGQLQMQKQLYFLIHADSFWLKEYEQIFCCLGHNFLKKKDLQFCQDSRSYGK